jgi:hypothetical protein
LWHTRRENPKYRLPTYSTPNYDLYQIARRPLALWWHVSALTRRSGRQVRDPECLLSSPTPDMLQRVGVGLTAATKKKRTETAKIVMQALGCFRVRLQASDYCDSNPQPPQLALRAVMLKTV